MGSAWQYGRHQYKGREVKKIMQQLEHTDKLLWELLVFDLLDGAILRDADTETLEILLLDIFNNKAQYTGKGLIVGTA